MPGPLSLKSTLGHLVIAAGATGVIKAALSLERKLTAWGRERLMILVSHHLAATREAHDVAGDLRDGGCDAGLVLRLEA